MYKTPKKIFLLGFELILIEEVKSGRWSRWITIKVQIRNFVRHFWSTFHFRFDINIFNKNSNWEEHIILEKIIWNATLKIYQNLKLFSVKKAMWVMLVVCFGCNILCIIWYKILYIKSSLKIITENSFNICPCFVTMKNWSFKWIIDVKKVSNYHANLQLAHILKGTCWSYN